MKQTINRYDFHRAFEELRPDNFSHAGLDLLFEQFEQYEEDADKEIELDVIAICCDWAESTAAEIVQDFGLDAVVFDMEPESDEYNEAALDYLNDHTSVAGMTDAGTIVYCAF